MTIKGLLASYRAELNVNVSELAAVAGLSTRSYDRRMNDASLWRLGELNSIYTFLNIPKEERIYHE